MIRYAAERYGRDHVAQIVTFSTIKARAAVRDAARVLGYPYIVGDKVAKAMPPLIMGRDTPLHACFEQQPKYADGYKMAAELRAMYDTDPDAKAVIDVAKGLEGLRRQDGIHAAAVVITKEALTDYLPIQRKPESGQDPEQAPVVTQYEMHGVEDLGLLKMDFLGLRNLDVITDTIEMIAKVRGVDVDIDRVDLEDAKTYELLRRAETIGVFQLEGGPMRALIQKLAPTGFDDVGALVALYRPGPMAANVHMDYADRKNERKPVAYLHPDAEPILASTYGLCLAGDTMVFDAETGEPVRLDAVGDRRRFRVQGLDADFRSVVRDVTAWTCTGEKDTVRLRLANGMELVGTPDHPVLTEQGWKPLSELTPADHVATPATLLEPERSQVLDEDHLRVLAYLLADGSLSNGASISFTNKDEDILRAFVDSMTSAFPDDRVQVDDQRGGSTRLRVVAPAGHRRSSLLGWLRSLGYKAPPGSVVGGPTSELKHVTPEVFAGTNESIARFLAALWDCDGHVGRNLAVYTTVSRRLAVDIQALLLRLGFEASMYQQAYERPRDGAAMAAYQVAVFDGPRFLRLISPHLASEAKRAIAFEGEASGTTLSRADVVSAVRAAWPGSITDLSRTYGLSRLNFNPGMVRDRPRIRAKTVATVLDGLQLRELQNRSRVNWVRVASVEPAGVHSVYDITVDDVHNFVANGIIAHNCVYQEQIMRLAQKFAGFTLAEADNLRKACGKKVRELIQKEREKFEQGCEAQGYGRELGKAWFDIIEPFADYAFNRSHSYGYGFVAYQTAYLKANFPVEYLACLLTSVRTNLDKAAIYLNECRQLGIPVHVPDVNRSQSDFVSVLDPEAGGRHGATIPFGLSAVRNVGTGLVELILAEREANGPYVDFYDFCERVDTSVLNKRTVESLVKAGGFDSLGHPRQGLLAVYEQIIDRTLARRRKEAEGQFDLFSAMDTTAGDAPAEPRIAVPEVEFDKKVRLSFEKEMLGLYVSDHPLMGAEGSLRRRTECTIAELETVEDGALRTIGGLVTALQRKWTKKGDLMAVFTLEDLQTSIEVMVFPKTMQLYGHLLEDDTVVVVKGRVDRRDDQPKIMVTELERFEPVTDGAPPVRISLSPAALSEAMLADLKGLLDEHPGESPVFLHLGDTKVLRLSEQFCVDASNGLVAELRVLLGADAVLV
jgi:intein/homing endonuclease